MEIATYAGLLNQKIIIPSSKGAYQGVDRYFLASCLRPFLETIRFDEQWYLGTQPDVREAIDSGIVPNAKEHYVRFGFFEHRMPYHIEVEESWYLAEYPDVRTAIERESFESGQAHFDAQGFREGRVPYPHFKLELDAVDATSRLPSNN
jgi:hypothetical protein